MRQTHDGTSWHPRPAEAIAPTPPEYMRERAS